ncbi:MAG: LacI family transcriptional regulator [Treponema sp.]|jgi:LacI family transcriptional regulator|nr:LacI family transcriptional regulator [Treponema sp.]
MPDTRIKDVAKHAGVSEATITRVVNKKGYVSEATRRKVLKSIKELNYIPNRMASALKNNCTGIIGNVLPFVPDNFFFSYMAAALRSAASSCDYQLLLMYNETNKNLRERLLHEVISRMVEGLVFTAEIASSHGAIREVLNKKIPVIMIERPLSMAGVDKILLDDFSGSAMAARKFLDMGHRTMGFIGKELRAGAVERNRFTGFKQELKKGGAALRETMSVFTPEYNAGYGYKAMKHIMEQDRKNRPTACFLAADALVCGALQYLYDAHLRIPEDISLIGYDNTLSAFCSPPITSVAVPYDEIGRLAISLFRERRDYDRHVDKTIQLSLSIMDRGSVADIRGLKRG